MGALGGNVEARTRLVADDTAGAERGSTFPESVLRLDSAPGVV